MPSLKHLHYCHKLPSSKDIEKIYESESSDGRIGCVEENYTRLTIDDKEYRSYFDSTLPSSEGIEPCELCVELAQDAEDIIKTLRSDKAFLDRKGIRRLWRRLERQQKWRHFFANFRVVLPKSQRAKLAEQDRLIEEFEDPNYRFKALKSLYKRRKAVAGNEMVEMYPDLSQEHVFDKKDENELILSRLDEEQELDGSGNHNASLTDTRSDGRLESSEHPPAENVMRSIAELRPSADRGQ